MSAASELTLKPPAGSLVRTTLWSFTWVTWQRRQSAERTLVPFACWLQDPATVQGWHADGVSTDKAGGLPAKGVNTRWPLPQQHGVQE